MGRHGRIHIMIIPSSACLIKDQTNRRETLKKNCSPVQPRGVCACSGAFRRGRVRHRPPPVGFSLVFTPHLWNAVVSGKSPHSYRCLVPLMGRLVACSTRTRVEKSDTQTNTRCACALRVKISTRRMRGIFGERKRAHNDCICTCHHSRV